MSKIKLFSNPLSAKSLVEYDIDEGTRLIDWLQEHYPEGFAGMLRVFVGVDELNLEDLDYAVQDQEQITMLVMPGQTTLATIAIQALVSIAIGYVINLVFAPATPSGYDAEEQSPIYNLGPTPNSSRLGLPIEAHYGRVSSPVPFAAAPYEMFDGGSNDMYVDQLHCLGHGTFQLHEILIGDTPVDQMEVGAVQYWLIPPSIHNNSENQVEDYINDYLSQTGNPISFIANCYTAPEVEDWLFNSSTGQVYDTPQAFAGNAYAATTDIFTGQPIAARITNIDVTLTYPKDEANPDNPQTGPFGSGIEVGDFIELAGTDWNNFVFQIGSIIPDPADPVNKVIFYQRVQDEQLLVDEAPLNAASTFTLNETSIVSNMKAGPYRAQKAGQVIDVVYIDIEFPALYHVDKDDDRLTTNSVDFEFTVQEIDETDGTPIGAPQVVTKRYSSKKRDPIRDTVEIRTLTAGAFEVTVERTTPISDNDRDLEEAHWTGLRSRVVPKPDGCYSDTSLLAVRMRATNGLGGAARSRLRVVMSRDQIFGGLNTTNPTVILKEIWNNSTFGLGRPLDELHPDIDIIGLTWELNGPVFNGSYQDKGTGFDAMQQAVSLAGARVIQEGGLINVVADQVQSVRKALFSDANIVRDSLSIEYSFDTQGETDYIEVEYRDPDSWQALYATWPESGGDNADSYKLFGCTDAVYAGQYAKYLANIKDRRRKIANFKVELEGMLVKFGDRIGIASSVVDWGHSGVVVEVVSATEIRVDGPLPWTSNNVMILRDELGGQLGEYSVTQGADTSTAVFSAAITAHGPIGLDPTNYIFGEDSTLIRDFMVTKVSPDTETTVAIEAQVYDEFIFEGGPPQMNPPSTTCKEYECDALQVELMSVYENVWDLQRDELGTPALDVDSYGWVRDELDPSNEAKYLNWYVSKSIGGAPLPNLDWCAGTFSSNLGSSGGMLGEEARGLPAADWITSTTTGSMAIYAGNNTANGNSIGLMSVNYSENDSVTLQRIGADMVIQVGNTGLPGNAAFFTYTNSWKDNDGALYCVNWDMDGATTGSTLTVELFVDGASLGTQTEIFEDDDRPTPPTYNYPRVYVGMQGGTGAYTSHMAGYRQSVITLEQAEQLAAALAQNQSDYVDPDPNCKEACAALYTALNETVDHHWPCSDDGNPLIDAIGTYNLSVVTQNPTPYQPSLTNGVCDGVYSMIGSHSDIFNKRNIINIEQGSFGGFFDYTSGGGRGMLLNFGSDSIGIYITHGPDPETDLTVYINDMNSGVNEDIIYSGVNSPLPDGSSPFIIVNYVVSPLLFKVEVELWSNFTSAGLNTRTIDVTPSGTNTYLWVNDANSSDNRVQNVFLNTLPLTEEEILYLKQGYDTNQP